jgi:hypothetical protein
MAQAIRDAMTPDPVCVDPCDGAAIGRAPASG